MYVCRWLVLCETVIHDKGSNNLTMINAITTMQASNFPVLHPKFAFAALIERVGEFEGPLSLRFLREKEPEDEVLVTVSGGDNSIARTQFFLNFPRGIRLFSEGTVTYRLEAREGDANWYVLGSQSVQVSALPQPTAEKVENEASIEKPAKNVQHTSPRKPSRRLKKRK